MKWPIKPIGETCDVIPGFAFKSSDLGNDGIPVVKIGNITENYSVDIHNIQHIPPQLISEKHSKFKLKNGDILIAMTGATVGKVGRIHCEEENEFLLNQRVAKILPKTIHPDFLWLSISSSRYKTIFKRLAGGAAQPNMSGPQIESVEIPYPPSDIQESLANILTSYDDLIENNRRRIKLLEEAARLIYREWFVHFRFPGHEHVKITNGLPTGWTIYNFADLVDFKEGPGLRNYQYRDEGIPFLNIRTMDKDDIDLSKVQYLNEEEVENKYEHFLLKEDDHVVSSSGTLGRVVTIRAAHLPMLLNTSIIRMRPKEPMTKWFLKAYLKHGDFIKKVSAMATGSAQLNYGPSHLQSLSMVFPNKDLVTMYEEYAAPIYTQVKALLDTNYYLSQARDILLPRLMNGTIEILEARKVAEKSIRRAAKVAA